MKRGLTFYITTGVVLGVLLLSAMPVQAQWTVYDPANHKSQIEEAIAEAARWVKTVEKYSKDLEHYAQMYEKAVEQLTTMKGVLKTVDDQLAKHKAMIGLVNDVGTIIRGAFTLRDQLERLVLHRIQALKNIDSRLRNGIFDPAADARDFEQYLRYTIGRSARDTLARRERLVKADAQLTYLMDEKTKVEAEIAELYAQLKAAEKMLAAEMATPPAQRRDITALTLTINHLSARLAELQAKHAELMEKITKRIEQHGLRIAEMENFGRQVVAVNDAWSEFQKVKTDIARTLDNLVMGR